jgi:membrane-bound lytic murein transglycosylase B
MIRALLTCLVLLHLGTAAGAEAKAENFAAWKQGFVVKLERQGFSPQATALFLNAAHYLEQPVRAQARQPETTATFASYRHNLLTETRIATGQALLREHSAFYARLAERYGVEPQLLVALWGIESSYGRNLGRHPVIAALASLAYAGKRPEFFEKQLVAAVRIAARGEVAVEVMTGSWAGAMGHYQFIPTTFEAYGTDGDGDGRRDIWGSYADAAASAGNYLQQIGWRRGTAQIHRVAPGRAKALLEGEKASRYRTAAAWRQAGLPPTKSVADATRLKLVAPDDGRSGYYLVGEGFDRLREWNRSTYFALTVLLLAEQVAAEALPAPIQTH